MAYSELIKDIARIRVYMREFFVYGFKSRDEVGTKSARSYDNEKRRIESWLGEFMSFRQDASGKAVFFSVDSRHIPHNPLYKAWQAATFTKNDINLHFILLDILADGKPRGIPELLDAIDNDYLAHFVRHVPSVAPGGRQASKSHGSQTSSGPQPIDAPGGRQASKGHGSLPSGLTEPMDESTLRKKLKEYTGLGLFAAIKQGKQFLYTLPPDFAGLESRLEPWRSAVTFFSEAAPLGVVGSFLLDKFAYAGPSSPGRPAPADTARHHSSPAGSGSAAPSGGPFGDVRPEVTDLPACPGGALPAFSFKHRYLLFALDQGVMLDLLEAIHGHHIVELELASDHRGGVKRSVVVPLKIFVSTQGGRQYVATYSGWKMRIVFFRLDAIVGVKSLGAVTDTDPSCDRPAQPTDGGQCHFGALTDTDPSWDTERSSRRRAPHEHGRADAAEPARAETHLLRRHRQIPPRADAAEPARAETPTLDFDAMQALLANERPHIWGVSCGSYHIEHIEMALAVDPKDTHIIHRLLREKRCGEVTQTAAGEWTFSADVYDAMELMPWLRSFIGRISSLACSNKEVERRFWDDYATMASMYGCGTPTRQPAPEGVPASPPCGDYLPGSPSTPKGVPASHPHRDYPPEMDEVQPVPASCRGKGDADDAVQ
ncbi:MAG: WYL domain-containing protein [Lachnospiraceae bacterium]|jgi:hypothetical protein|nr:WYL domain-containing protein [Lachnospiraceae bacterium]